MHRGVDAAGFGGGSSGLGAKLTPFPQGFLSESEEPPPKHVYRLRNGHGASSTGIELEDVAPVVVGELEGATRSYEFSGVKGSVGRTQVSVKTLPHDEGNLGGRVWSSSIAMGMWAAAHPELFEGRHVLELGSGVGLGGVAVWSSTQVRFDQKSTSYAMHGNSG